MKLPKILNRIRIASAFAFGGSSWEGANRSPNRSPVNTVSPTDFKHELNSYTLSELVKGMRYLRKNSGFVREYVNTMARYSAPVTPQSLVANAAWRKKAEALYAEKRRRADITGRFSGAQVQKLISNAIDTDGEIFVIRVFEYGEPKLQLIETHRVGDFGTGKTTDGFKLNKHGRPTHIQVMLDSGVLRMVPMSAVMHVYDPDSPSSLRHAPSLSHAINHRLDVEELLALEKKGVKDNQDITRVITKAGNDDFDDEDLRELVGATDDDNVETTDPKSLQKILGGKAALLKEGEKLESFQSNRPNPTFTGFIDHLDKESALGGLPYEFFANPSKISSPAVRLIVARVQRIANERSQIILDNFLRADWFFVIGNAIDRGELRPIKNWHKIAGGFPKQITVDSGRNDESLRRNIEIGITPPSWHYSELGTTLADAMEQKAMDLKEINEIAERHGLEPAQLMSFEGSGGGGIAGTPPSAKEPKVEEKKKEDPPKKDDEKKKKESDEKKD